MHQLQDKIRFIVSHLILTTLVVNTSSELQDKLYFYIEYLQVQEKKKNPTTVTVQHGKQKLLCLQSYHSTTAGH